MKNIDINYDMLVSYYYHKAKNNNALKPLGGVEKLIYYIN